MKRKYQIQVIMLLALLFFPLFLFNTAVLFCEGPKSFSLISDKQIEVERKQVFYRQAFSGKEHTKNLVFLHGWAARNGDCKGTDGVIYALSEHFNITMIEIPGLIRSEPPDTVWDMNDYAGHVHKTIDRLGIDSYILMGQSFGGGIASTVADLYPEGIEHLVLVDAVQSNRPENFYYKARFYFNPVIKWILENRYVPNGTKRFVMTFYFGAPWSFTATVDAGSYAVMPDVQSNYEVTTDYSLLTMPLLMVWGDNDTKVTPLSRADEIHDEVPGSELVIVEGGHTVLYSKPHKVVEAIITVL